MNNYDDIYPPYDVNERFIHGECENQCRSTVISQYILRYPQSLAKTNEYGYLPLHILLRNESSSIDDALLMIEIYPAALQHQNNNGQQPLHIECVHQRRSCIISTCIELYPESLKVSDYWGDLPLHVLLPSVMLRKFVASPIDLVQLMIEKYPAALEHQNGQGELPLHLECHYNCRSILISQLIERYPEALAVADENGFLPLHKLLWKQPSSIDDALMMIEKYPAALHHHDGYDYRPFHYECMAQCRPSLISKCIEIDPESLDDRAIYALINKIRKSNFFEYSSVLQLVFATRPMSLYQVLPVDCDIRKDPTYRRRILNQLPRHVFTPNHQSDYQDLNWQSRASIMMLLTQMKMQQQSRQRQQKRPSNRNKNADEAVLPS
jgi:ankyrin repeat protein